MEKEEFLIDYFIEKSSKKSLDTLIKNNKPWLKSIYLLYFTLLYILLSIEVVLIKCARANSIATNLEILFYVFLF